MFVQLLRTNINYKTQQNEENPHDLESNEVSLSDVRVDEANHTAPPDSATMPLFQHHKPAQKRVFLESV